MGTPATKTPAFTLQPVTIAGVPFAEYERTIGYRSRPDPAWTPEQVQAWEASRALVDAWIMVGGLAHGPRRIKRLAAGFRRQDVTEYLFLSIKALEAVIAPLFLEWLQHQERERTMDHGHENAQG